MFDSWLTDRPVFRIVLRDAKRYDTYETRQFDLPLNTTFPIGRASSNVTKKELMAAPHNAFIDSPVISRQHAVLSANSSTGTPEVYISDQNSMHGTMLNGQRLPPKTPTKLTYGDELQFGTDVNRNEEFFVARKYVFESQLSQPFSLGFTVPDAESEDEEVERRGSHDDPFVIEDDSDTAPDQFGQCNQAETTIVMDDILQQEQPAKPSRFGPDVYPEPASNTTVAGDAYKGEKQDADMPALESASCGDDSLVPPSPSLGSVEDDDVALDIDFDSKAGSIDSSEIGSEFESEIQESEDDMDGAGYSEAVTASATHDVQYSNNDMVSASKQPASAQSSNVSVRNIYRFEGSCDVPPRLPRVDRFGELQRLEDSDHTRAESSRLGMTKVAKIDRMPSCSDTAPPLPPRPSSKQASWGSWSYPSFGQNDTQGWYQDGMQQASYINLGYGEQASLFSPAVDHPPAPESTDAHIPVSFGQQLSQTSQADRLQTPPPASTLDTDACTPLQPGRRTKVSIEEIVEDVVEEHPPTPESVNCMKRKADVLEDELEVTQEEMPRTAIAVDQTTSGPTNLDSVPETSATQTAAQIAQRPKKIPRSVLGQVLNKAAYPLLGATGAVVSFALLSTLPDNFFM